MAQSILNADMATVGRWLREGWTWWTGELAAMLPSSLRRRTGAARGLVGWYEKGRALSFTRGGAAAAAVPGTAVVIALPPSLCLQRTIRLPALGEADVRRLVALQLDRLLPFPPGSALVDIDLGPLDSTTGQRSVTVAALPAEIGGDIATLSEAAELPLRAISLATPDGALIYDFLPALRAARGEPDSSNARRFWWRVVAALLALNIVVLVATDMIALHHEEALVDAHAQGAEGARLARHRVMAEDSWRRSLLAQRSVHDPLVLLSDLSRRLPDNSWIQHLTVDGAQVRIAGFRHGEADLLGLLRNAGYKDVHASTSDVLAAGSAGQPFDITFTLPGATG